VDLEAQWNNNGEAAYEYGRRVRWGCSWRLVIVWLLSKSARTLKHDTILISQVKSNIEICMVVEDVLADVVVLAGLACRYCMSNT
jgi:hypothetical protein